MAFRPAFALSLRSAAPLFAIAGVTALLPEAFAAAFEFARGEIAHGQVWRLWTGHLVYFSTWHALADLAALVTVAALAFLALDSHRVWLGLLLGAPLVSLGLFWLVPDMTSYRGSSALSYLLGTAAGIELWRARPDWRAAVAIVASLAAAKVLLEAVGASETVSSLPNGVQVAWQAHLLGALAAIAGTACWRWLRPGRPLSGDPCTLR
jgi:rhomboid family GlyGly-CTERM serine protease